MLDPRSLRPRQHREAVSEKPKQNKQKGEKTRQVGKRHAVLEHVHTGIKNCVSCDHAHLINKAGVVPWKSAGLWGMASIRKCPES